MLRTLFLVVTSLFVLTACTQQTTQQPMASQGPTYDKKQIKLDTFSSSPALCLAHDSGASLDDAEVNSCICNQEPDDLGWFITCRNDQCVKVVDGRTHQTLNCVDQVFQDKGFNRNQPDIWCSQDLLAPTDGTFCIGKPVIYLYPTEKTLVDVTVESAGRIFVSDPLYPPEGWQDVEAHPDGTLYYKGEKYRELFYETETQHVAAPSTGVTIPTSHLKPSLTLLIDQLGLTPPERDEFLDFWVPKLQALNSPYIFFSVLEPLEKHRLDSVHLSPEPDTRIEFIAYFRPMTSQWSGPSLTLPSTPKRSGFTMVEWGGVIDPQSHN